MKSLIEQLIEAEASYRRSERIHGPKSATTQRRLREFVLLKVRVMGLKPRKAA